MKLTANYHTHTCLCDGCDTPEQMARAAWEQGFSVLGFSGHGYTSFDGDFCMSLENEREYRRRVSALKQEYAGQMEILCGVEQDYLAGTWDAEYDYAIGSVHYVCPEGKPICIDGSVQRIQNTVEAYYSGDPYLLIEAYYALVSRLGEIRPDIIGHFDLITKFQEKTPWFDESHPRYRKAARQAMEALLPLNIPFELNTGAMAKNWRTTPYPAAWLLEELGKAGGCVIFSSDCHDYRKLDWGWKETRELAQSCGVQLLVQLPRTAAR